MFSFNVLAIRIRKNIIPFFICLFIIFLLIFSNTSLEACKKGLKLWANSVVPSLLPFFIATELLGYTNVINLLGKLLNRFMKPIFNVSGIGSFPFIMGIITGYPIGAKIVSNLKIEGKLSSIEAERLIAYANNSGPLFIIGTVGICLYKSVSVGVLLLITHILSSLTVGFLFRWWKYNSQEKKKELSFLSLDSIKNEISPSNLGEILSTSIMNAINTVFLIGGFIVLFCIIISILEPIICIFDKYSSFTNGIISGIIELTNGLYKISLISNKNYYLSIIISSFLIGFGGFSVLFQILSIISKAKISINPYIIGKLLQSIFAAVYTYLFIICFLPLQLAL